MHEIALPHLTGEVNSPHYIYEKCDNVILPEWKLKAVLPDPANKNDGRLSLLT